MKVGFMGLLFLVFLTLKLCGVIAWSWVWVTAPLWIGFAIAILVVVIVIFVKVLSVRKAVRRRDKKITASFLK